MMPISLFSLGCHAAQAEAGSAGAQVVLRLGPLDVAAIPALQALYAQLLAPAAAPDLASTLQDAARGHGRQVLLAWRAGQPVGCAGWVGLGIARDGQCFAAPLFAADADAASALLSSVSREARRLGARSLRVSAWAGEDAKLQALRAAGFQYCFDWVQFACATAGARAVDFAAAGWQRVAPADFDWPQLAALYASTFRAVPNAPPVDLATFQAEWQPADWDAGCVLADATGRYRAFCLIEDGAVEAVGVDEALRGQGLARLLYQHACERLALRGITTLSTLVASSNHASLGLHQGLGFYEAQPRGAVYELQLC